MLLPATPLNFRNRASRARAGRIPPAPPPPPPPTALMLVSAAYNESGGPSGEALLILTFDRPVDISAFSGAAITVKDGQVNASQYQGLSAALTGPATVEITLEQTGSYFEQDQLMSATALSGIVAVNDGGTWEGVSDLPLPFP